MATDRVGDITIEELRALINQIMDERGIRILPRRSGGRSVGEVMESISRHRITPPPGAKSNLELIREDRDR